MHATLTSDLGVDILRLGRGQNWLLLDLRLGNSELHLINYQDNQHLFGQVSYLAGLGPLAVACSSGRLRSEGVGHIAPISDEVGVAVLALVGRRQSGCAAAGHDSRVLDSLVLLSGRIPGIVLNLACFGRLLSVLPNSAGSGNAPRASKVRWQLSVLLQVGCRNGTHNRVGFGRDLACQVRRQSGNGRHCLIGNAGCITAGTDNRVRGSRAITGEHLGEDLVGSGALSSALQLSQTKASKTGHGGSWERIIVTKEVGVGKVASPDGFVFLLDGNVAGFQRRRRDTGLLGLGPGSASLTNLRR